MNSSKLFKICPKGKTIDNRRAATCGQMDKQNPLEKRDKKSAAFFSFQSKTCGSGGFVVHFFPQTAPSACMRLLKFRLSGESKKVGIVKWR